MLGQRTAFYLSKEETNTLLLSGVESEPVVVLGEYKKVDITKRDEVKRLIYDFYPDVIINAAAFTNVDACETEKELSWKVNVKAVEYMAEAARVTDAHIIHLSSDYVFDGSKGYYSEQDIPNPISYYGRTKLASENVLKISGTNHTIIRTNVLFGIVDKGRKDFVRWVVDSLKNNEPISIVTDQINNPTYLDDLAEALKLLIEFKKYGLYHIGGSDFLSRFDFTMRITEYFDLDKKLVKPIITEDLNQPAKRPLKSGLITLKAESELGYKPRSIEEAFTLMKNYYYG